MARCVRNLARDVGLSDHDGMPVSGGQHRFQRVFVGGRENPATPLEDIYMLQEPQEVEGPPIRAWKVYEDYVRSTL